VGEYQRYEVCVETRVVVKSVLLSGGELVVGEYVVRAQVPAGAGGQRPGDIPNMVDQAMAKNAKQARTMAAGVDNTERNRTK